MDFHSAYLNLLAISSAEGNLKDDGTSKYGLGRHEIIWYLKAFGIFLIFGPKFDWDNYKMWFAHLNSSSSFTGNLIFYGKQKVMDQAHYYAQQPALT